MVNSTECPHLISGDLRETFSVLWNFDATIFEVMISCGNFFSG